MGQETSSNLSSTGFRHMRPGGWVEIQEFDSRANCDDGSLPEDAPLKKFFDTASEAVKSFNMNFRAGENLGEMIKEAGFVNVGCVKLKVPIGTWPKVWITASEQSFCLESMFSNGSNYN